MDEFFDHIDTYDRRLGANEGFVIHKKTYRVCSVFRNEDTYQVFLVKDEADCPFVLKIAEDYRREILRAEHALLTKLAHEGIPKALCCEEQGVRTLFLREYVPGQTLADYAEEQTFTASEIAHLVMKACRIVSFLHQQHPPIIHRDIKPENFIVTSAGELVLIDLGTAQLYDANKSTDTVLLGTIATAAPEQFGARRSDIRSDVYGIGMSMVYLLTNGTDPRLLSAQGAPRWLKRIIRRCLSFDPDRRYPTMAALEAKLHRALGRKNRWIAAICAIVLLSCAAIWAKVETDHHKAIQAAENAESVVVFAEPLIEQAVANRLGIPPGTITAADLERVRSLLLGGNTPYDYWGEVECAGHGGTFLNTPGDAQALPRGNIRSLEDLRRLPNLQRLALYSQDLTDISALAGLPLTHLALGDNEIEDFSVLASLTHLVCLDLAGTKFKDAALISACAALESLVIVDTPLWDLSPLADLPLHELRLDYANICENDAVLEEFPALTLLKLALAPEKTLSVVGRLSHLETLDLTGFSGSTLEPLRHLTRLRQLFVGSGRLASLTGAEAMVSLEVLVIANSAVSDLSPLFALPRLKELAIGNSAVTDYTQLRKIPSLQTVGVASAREQALLQEIHGPFAIRIEGW